MGHKVPFKPKGTCSDCMFSEPIHQSHFMKRYHSLFCRLNPPIGPGQAPGDGPWNIPTPVHDNGYCSKWKQE